MNPTNIRFRIALWYGLTVFIAAAIIFAGFYLVTRQILFQQVDRELSLHAGKLADIASSQGINIHEAVLKQRLYNEFSDIPGMVVVLLDNNGSVIRSSLMTNNPYAAFNLLFQQARSGEVAYLNQSINNIPLRFIAVPINGGGDFFGVVLVAHPIEAIQKSLNQLFQALAVIFGVIIIPLGIYFNRLLGQLQRAINRERQFIGDVAHELKTPVATLSSGIELALLKPRSNQEYQKALAENLIDANRLSNTIKNVLDLAWLESENANFQPRPFNLSQTLNELKEIAQKLAVKKNLRFKAEIDPRVFVAGSEDKIARAVLNIIDNAIKFTPKGKSIFIGLTKVNGRAVIEVKDTGAGISADELPHIFERFYRGSKSAKTFGSGLGLAIAQGIIKAHRGAINVFSQSGQGTTVVISLPLQL